MGAATAKNVVLLATDLASFEANILQLRPVIAALGGTEDGHGLWLLVSCRFPPTADGFARAVSCGRKLQNAVNGKAYLATALHVGQARTATTP